MTATLAQLAGILRAQLGVHEDPYGSNKVLYNRWFYGREVSGASYAWCMALQSWAFAQAGAIDLIGGKTASCATAAKRFQTAGRWSTTPRVGALALYYRPEVKRIGHVGWVEAVHPDGSWDAIEGNTDVAGGRTGGQVLRQRRSTCGPGGGFGLITYANATNAAAALSPAAAAAVYASPAGTDVRKPDTLPQVRAGRDAGGWDYLAQQALAEAGLYTGPMDGVLNPGGPTDRAIRELQRRHKLSDDGIIGQRTWAALAGVKGTLKPGMRGLVAIEVLQNFLGWRGADCDRVYGPATTARVQAVQRWHALDADGIAGPATFAALASS